MEISEQVRRTGPDAGHASEANSGFWRVPTAVEAILGEPGVADAIEDAQFRMMADYLPTLCWMARSDGYIVWYNKRWHDYCGTTAEAMEGWGWQSVHDPDHLPRVLERWAASIAAGAPFEMVFPLRGSDGVFRPFLTRIAPLRDGSGKVARWFGVNTEVGAQLRAQAAQEKAEADRKDAEAARVVSQARYEASEAKYNVLTEAMPQMVWSTLPDGFHDYYNAQWYEFTGVPHGSTDGEAWNGMFHADDQERAWARWRHSLATGEPYEIEYRLRHRSGAYRWTLGRALPVRDENGEIVRWIGTCTDIHDAKLASERNEVLTRELSHRIKNIFAIIAGLIRMSMRRDPAAGQFARDLLERVGALGRAHEFARPHSEDSMPRVADAMIQGMLRTLFSPYDDRDQPRIAVSGVDVPIDDRGATPIALLFHELATNAAKYGALSTEQGQVSVNLLQKDDDEIVMRWSEQGGPLIEGPPTREGFGTRLAAMSVEQQLGGQIERQWLPQGLQTIVIVKRSRLSRAM